MMYQHSTRMGKALNIYRQFLLSIYRELEENIRYIMRCLQRINQPFELDKIYSILGDGDIYAVMYPYEGEDNLKDCNPMFFLGLKVIPPQQDKKYISITRINQISDIW